MCKTPAGWPFVSLQIAAVMTFAAPSMSLATGLFGFRIAAATYNQLMPCSAEGRYCACGRRYWLPTSTATSELAAPAIRSPFRRWARPAAARCAATRSRALRGGLRVSAWLRWSQRPGEEAPHWGACRTKLLI